MCSRRVGSSCSTSGIHRVTLVTNPVISHEYRKGPGSVTTSGTQRWSTYPGHKQIHLHCRVRTIRYIYIYIYQSIFLVFFCPVLETNTTPKGDLVKCQSGYKTYTIQHTMSVCCRNRTLIGFTCTKACLAPLNLRVSFKSVPRCNRYNFGVINGVSYLMWACIFYIVLETSISYFITNSGQLCAHVFQTCITSPLLVVNCYTQIQQLLAIFIFLF